MTTKTIRKLYRRFVSSALPRPIAHRLIRRSLRIPSDPPPELVFKLATSQNELEGAFHLLHDAYVREGYMTPHPSGLRVTPYHALPTTLVVIAKLKERVIATLTLIPAGPFGLPLEKSFDLASTLRSFPRTVEISSLAVDPEFAGSRGETLFPLMKFNYLCNRELLGTDIEVIGVNPKMTPLYEALLLFKRIKNSKAIPYAFVNNAPVVPMLFELHRAEELFAKAYRGAEAHADMTAFFAAPPSANYQLPDRETWRECLPQRDPAILRHFFVERTSTFAELGQAERECLRVLFAAHPELLAVVEHATSNQALSISEGA